MVTKLAADGQGLQTVGARYRADDAARPHDAADSLGEIFLILERGERADLADAIDAVVIADLLERANDARFAEAIANARAGKAVGFGKGAQPQDLRIADVDRQQLRRGRRIAIGFVEQQQHAGRQSGDERAQRIGTPERAHRIIGIADIEDARIFAPRRREQRLISCMSSR